MLQKEQSEMYIGGKSNAGRQAVGKSGTGCHKSGTGVVRGESRTPRAFKAPVLALLILTLVAAGPLLAQTPPGFTIVIDRGSVLVAFETDEGLVSGTVSEEAGSEGYHQVILFITDEVSASLLVKGSGSGTASGSCNDFGILVKGSGSGTASTGCYFDHPNAWGFAEVAIEGDDVLVTIHQVIDDAAVEYATVEL